HATGTGIVLQSSGGRCLVLDTKFLEPFFETPTTIAPWPHAPHAFDADRVCTWDANGQVQLLDLEKKKILWTHTAPLPPALTGELPRVFGGGETLLLLHPYSHGYQLERIDPKTGRVAWPAAARLSLSAFDADAVALDDKVVYYATGRLLQA